MAENKKVSPYKLQMDALLRSADDYEEAARRKAAARTQGEMMGQLGDFVNVASAPVATASEIMAQQTPQNLNLGQSLIRTGQGITQGGVDQYRDTLNRYNMQNQMVKTLADMKNLERDDELRNLKIQSLKQDIAEKKKPFAQSRAGQQYRMKLDADKKQMVTKGTEQRDKDFAKEWTKFNDLGGYTVIQSNLSKLKYARDAIQKAINERTKGGWNVGVSGKVIGTMPESTIPYIFPEAAQIQEAVAEVAQGNLRQVLGGQFAQKEGEQLIRRAYNPRLPEEMNLERLDRLINQIENAAGAKVAAGQYFENTGGTLKGYRGPSYDELFNFDDDDGGGEGGFINSATAGEMTLEDMSTEDLLKMSQELDSQIGG